ncbi:hypothetical protein D3C80_507180 [compost metagenome]
MWIVFPHGLQNRGGLAQIVFAQIGPCRDQSCRDQAFCELQSVLGILARTDRIAFQLFAGLGGEKHGFQALRFAAFDDAGRLLLVQQTDRVIPLSVATTIFQRRLCCPGQVGGFFRRVLGILLGGLISTLTAGLDIEAAKAKFAGLGIAGHGFEFAPRLVIFALNQVSLRIEQVDQRLLIGAEQPLRAGRHLAGENGIAGTGGNEAGGERLITAVALAGTEITTGGIG